jgi:protein-S-isoprenylcysteine O-methyltransferase Ste14
MIKADMLKAFSIVGLLVMIAALYGLIKIGSLFTPNHVAIALQVAAAGLMIWARLTLKWRSFHAAADPTAGGLVTTGPYRYIRHPIYAAVCLIGWAGVLTHLSAASLALGLVLLAGAFIRILCEEHLIVQVYPEYRSYAKATWRMVPYVF